ncbi:MAG: lipid-binding protein [Azospira oryzae]|jgi:polyisoprenoid-binding protein YceI|nr:MAG: lipid-binding protein [Azospira oryzae]
MKTRPVLSFITITFIITSLFAFIAPPAPVKFKVDSKASTLVWTGKKFTGQHTGTILLSSGEIATEGKAVKQGNFEIDVTSLTVTDIKDASSNAKLVGHLKNDDFFGVDQFPKASFVISSVTPKTGDEYTVKGKLTLKGITNDITFPAVIKNDGKKLTAVAKITVDRSKYNIKFKSPSFFENLGDGVIYDEFELDLNLVAHSQRGV